MFTLKDYEDKGANSLCYLSASYESHLNFKAMMTCRHQHPMSNRSMCAWLHKCVVMCECNPLTDCDRPLIEIYKQVSVNIILLLECQH